MAKKSKRLSRIQTKHIALVENRTYYRGPMSKKDFKNFADWLIGEKSWKQAFGYDMPKPTNKL